MIYESTGEVRPPNHGEYFLTWEPWFRWYECPRRGIFQFKGESADQPRVIMRPKPDNVIDPLELLDQGLSTEDKEEILKIIEEEVANIHRARTDRTWLLAAAILGLVGGCMAVSVLVEVMK